MKLQQAKFEISNFTYVHVPSKKEQSSMSQKTTSLVFIHGFPGRPQDFRWLVPYLEDFHLYFIALPGQGLTPSLSNTPNDIHSACSFVESCIDFLKIQDFCIVGHSMGGALASHIASKNPRCTGLILLSSVGIRPHMGFRKFGNPKLAYHLISQHRYRHFQGIIQPLLKGFFMLAGFPKGIDRNTIKTVVEHAYHFSFTEHHNDLRNVQQRNIPLALIYSQNDPLIEVSIFEEVGTLTSSSQIKVFEDGGHNPQKKYAQDIGNFIVDWISKNIAVL